MRESWRFNAATPSRCGLFGRDSSNSSVALISRFSMGIVELAATLRLRTPAPLAQTTLPLRRSSLLRIPSRLSREPGLFRCTTLEKGLRSRVWILIVSLFFFLRL